MHAQIAAVINETPRHVVFISIAPSIRVLPAEEGAGASTMPALHHEAMLPTRTGDCNDEIAYVANAVNSA
jgi:hypothetical protein